MARQPSKPNARNRASISAARRVIATVFWILRSLPLHQQWDSYASGATFRALTLDPKRCTFARPGLEDDEQSRILGSGDGED